MRRSRYSPIRCSLTTRNLSTMFSRREDHLVDQYVVSHDHQRPVIEITIDACLPDTSDQRGFYVHREGEGIEFVPHAAKSTRRKREQ